MPYSSLAGPPVDHDARGIGISTNADPNQGQEGLPGSRLGAAPTRTGKFGPTPGVRTDSRSGGIHVSSTVDADPANQREQPSAAAPAGQPATPDGPPTPGPTPPGMP